jgi:hypothetical protein
MELILAGPIDGKIKNFYQVLKDYPPNMWVLCTGDFGIWPDPARIDRGTRQNTGAGDFAQLYLNGYSAPKQTLFVAGVHEDHKWLKHRFFSRNLQLISNLHWLANGNKTTIGDMDNVIRITGFGKVYSKATFRGQLNKKSYRHYTRNEFEKACSSGPTDILLLHEKPENEIIRKIVFATRPKLIVHSTRESFEEYEFMGTKTIGLPKNYVKVEELEWVK